MKNVMVGLNFTHVNFRFQKRNDELDPEKMETITISVIGKEPMLPIASPKMTVQP